MFFSSTSPTNQVLPWTRVDHASNSRSISRNFIFWRIENILKYIPAFHNALKSRFPNTSCTLDDQYQENAIATIGQEVIKSIIDPNNPDILPDVGDPFYLKVVTVCLVAFGTENRVFTAYNSERRSKEALHSHGCHHCTCCRDVSQDVDGAAVLQYAKIEGKLEDFVPLFLNSKHMQLPQERRRRREQWW